MAQTTTTVNYKNFKVGESELPIKEHMVLKLRPIPSRDSFQYIEKITNRFDKTHNFNESFIQQLQIRLDSDKIICQGEIEAPLEKSIREKVNGFNNYYLFQTTIHQDVAMIWCDESVERPSYKVWGERDNVIRAINILKFKIDKEKNQ